MERRLAEQRRARPLLFVHGVYHRAWCFTEHFFGYFAEHGRDVYAIDLPLSERDFDLGACARAIREAFCAIDPRPIVVGHSLGGRLVHSIAGEIDRAILLSPPTRAELVREALRAPLGYPLHAARAFTTGRSEHLYHHAPFADAYFFSSTVRAPDFERYLAQIRTVRYPRGALASILALPPSTHPADTRVDVIVGELDPTCGSRRDAHRVLGAPHDLMLGEAWPRAASLIAELVR